MNPCIKTDNKKRKLLFVRTLAKAREYEDQVRNHTDAKGNLRELHTELAKDAIDYHLADNYRMAYTPCKDRRVELLDTPYYRTSLLDLTQPMTCDYTELDSFVVYVCVGGKATLVPDGGAACTLAQGETVLVPACVRTVEIRPEGGVKLLECGV